MTELQEVKQENIEKLKEIEEQVLARQRMLDEDKEAKCKQLEVEIARKQKDIDEKQKVLLA